MCGGSSATSAGPSGRTALLQACGRPGARRGRLPRRRRAARACRMCASARTRVRGFHRGCEQAGISATTTSTAPTRKVVGYFQLTNRNGRRCSSAVAYLKPARSRPNLTIITHAQVQSLVLEGKRVTGVRYLQHGAPKLAHAAREIVLSAGAIGSPQILELSGIGAPGVLKAAGVDVRHDCQASARTCWITCRSASSIAASSLAASTRSGTAHRALESGARITWRSVRASSR